LADYSSSYKERLIKLDLLPLMYWLELQDVLFLINSNKSLTHHTLHSTSHLTPCSLFIIIIILISFIILIFIYYSYFIMAPSSNDSWPSTNCLFNLLVIYILLVTGCKVVLKLKLN